jgi:hypothetical protein
MHPVLKTATAGAVFAAVVTVGMLIVSKPGQAANDNNGAQDEKQMSQIGLAEAQNSGIHLTIGTKDPELVGLGGYLVNVSNDCNGCHSNPQTAYAPGGNPYLLPGPHPPFFSGTKQINPATYLGGNRDFGSFGPGAGGEIISRNLTPDHTGLAEGGTSLANFMLTMRTGKDLDHAHPSCAPPGIVTNCISPPFNGELLQIMPWPAFQNMTDRQLTAMYLYLSSIPCLEGGPGEPLDRCKK